jgi:hypothetical protein
MAGGLINLTATIDAKVVSSANLLYPPRGTVTFLQDNIVMREWSIQNGNRIPVLVFPSPAVAGESAAHLKNVGWLGYLTPGIYTFTAAYSGDWLHLGGVVTYGQVVVQKQAFAGAPPQVTSLGTNAGTTGGGTSVAISGSGFTGANQVFFGQAPASSFVINSDTSITAISPAHPSGTWDVSVLNPAGKSAPAVGDRYTFNSGA